MSQRVRELVEAPLTAEGLELVEVEHTGGVLRVTIDRPEGLDLESISVATRLVSSVIDGDDPLPGRYTLEVSSPGVERPLRTPDHFRRFVGRRVAVRTVAGFDGERRLEGELESADDDGIVVARTTVPYDRVERARTVFVWPAEANR
ncbi:MAG: ribosome maturation factor RimP [Acidimicrobiales bacterium]